MKIFKKLASIITLMVIMMPALMAAMPASALDANDLGLNYAESTGLGNKDPRDIAANVIKVILGFLGIVAVVIILLGGFKWMTAAGNEDKVGEAKKLITAGIIGLVIILAAFGIATFVINNLLNATST